MDQIDILLRILARFPGPSEPLNSFARIEKELKDRLKVTKASLLISQPKGFVALAGKGEVAVQVHDPLYRRLIHSRKPILLPRLTWTGLSGFWPLKTVGEGKACWALGPKRDGKKMNAGEMKLMGLVAERTTLSLDYHDLWTRLEEAGRQASLGLMTAAMAHEIRNPLTALSTLIQLLPQKGKDAAFLESFQKLTQREIDRLTQLTSTFLDLAKPSPEKNGKFELAPLMEQVGALMGPLLQTKGVKLSIRPAPGIFLKGNEHQIESLVLNLVQNAYRSVEKDGRIAVSSKRIRTKNAGTGPWVVIQVRDDGRGIAPENLEKVFSPYFTTGQEGTGLGLAICQRVVEFHGGSLKVKSAPQKGAIFTVLLPALGS